MKVCKPKNTSKSNATTGEEQAILDMVSKIREKLQEDYFKTEKEAMNSTVILPMLAKKFEDEESKIDWSNCYIQPKLDGQRALNKCTEEDNSILLSRDGIDIQKSHGSMQHIIDEFSKVKHNIIYDGELYCHSKEDNFQDIIKAIKKYRLGVSELVKHYIYDVVSDKSFKERFIDLEINNPVCVKVSTYKISSKEEMIKYHEQFLKEGYEGSIIRWGNEGYKLNGRSSNLLKYKDFQDSDYLIIDVIPAENRPEWGMIVCQSNYGTFDATPKMSHDKKKEILLNKEEYIGQTAVIKHFSYTESGLPRFPIFLGIRNDNLIK
jgi:DNA ligase-1